MINYTEGYHDYHIYTEEYFRTMFCHCQINNKKEEKDWLYPQMFEAVKKVTDSIILMFSPITLPYLVNQRLR